MHCYIYYVCIHKYLKVSSEIQIFNSGFLSSGHCIYVSKDVRIHAFFQSQIGVRE